MYCIRVDKPLQINAYSKIDTFMLLNIIHTRGWTTATVPPKKKKSNIFIIIYIKGDI